MRRRSHDKPGELQPMPTELVGVGTVEHWVDPRERLDLLGVDEARRAALGDTPTEHQARLHAEHRLAAARDEWERTERPIPATTPPDAVSASRPRPLAGRPTAASLEIDERRRWALAGGRAVCEFADREAYA